jgi:ribosomal protein S16
MIRLFFVFFGLAYKRLDRVRHLSADPDKKPAELKVDHAKLEKWLKVGAQMSDTVKSLVRKSKKDKK